MLGRIISTLLLALVISFSTSAQKKGKEYDAKKHAYQVHQHVYVTLKDGSEVEAIIHGHISKKKYYVRQYHSKKQGKVHEKYLRAMSDEEVNKLTKK